MSKLRTRKTNRRRAEKQQKKSYAEVLKSVPERLTTPVVKFANVVSNAVNVATPSPAKGSTDVKSVMKKVATKEIVPVQDAKISSKDISGKKKEEASSKLKKYVPEYSPPSTPSPSDFLTSPSPERLKTPKSQLHLHPVGHPAPQKKVILHL